MDKVIKIGCLVVLFAICGITSSAQYKNDKWIVGVEPLLFNFQDDTLTNTVMPSNLVYFRQAHSNINDSSGLLLSCDGYNIYDKSNTLIENGDNILPHKINSFYTNQLIQQSIILPKKDSQFYVFAWGISDKNFDLAQVNGGWYIYDVMTYSVVDMKENNGKGKVISKMNYLIEDDSLSICQMSATRHANGRDWWLLKPHLYRHKFYVFLVTPEGIERQADQEFDSPMFANGVNGQSNFSPDGSLYVMTSEFNNNITQINYFDRCTGKMSKYKTIPWVYDSIIQMYRVVGVSCFSSNNKYVYLINNLSILQHNLETGEQIELNIDGKLFENGNNLAYNAPDGRIYIGNWIKVYSAMSYIEFPDKKGADAHFCRMCYQTKNINTASPPNMPNYRLGALVGSACDTLNLVPPVDTLYTIKIYPVPASDILYIELPTKTQRVSMVVYNTLGAVVDRYAASPLLTTKLNIRTASYASGVYHLKISTESGDYFRKFTIE
jgi:hypothetical protein